MDTLVCDDVKSTVSCTDDCDDVKYPAALSAKEGRDGVDLLVDPVSEFDLCK
jgi:hypothetical protein